MGRNAGWLTAASVLARTDYSPAPDLIYLPEVPFDMDQFIEDVKAVKAKRKNVIIAVSEGIKDFEGQYISASSGSVDAFGHKQLCGAGKTLENILKAELGCKVRSVELNVLQRSAAHIASKRDLEESVAIGKAAAKLGREGETAKMLCYERISDAPYQINIFAHDIADIANQEKTVPRSWINKRGNDLTHEAITYLRPLIEGEVHLSYLNGVPHYCNIAHLHG